jgi:polysaccharide export outer membrane protein
LSVTKRKMWRKCAVFIVISIALLFSSGCATYSDLKPGTVRDITAEQGVVSGLGVKEEKSIQWRDGNLYFFKKKTVTHVVPKEHSPIVEQQTVTVPFAEETPPPSDYVVGPNDVLFINVNGNPAFSSVFGGVIGSSVAASPSGYTSRSLLGSRVDGNGNIQVPFIGVVKVGGTTLTEIQARLEGLFRKYIKEPWVTVEMVEYKSHPLYLLGEFRNSGTVYMDRPMNLLQGLSLGNGYDSAANLAGARLIRDRKILPIDIYALLSDGDLRQNIWLKPGDTIFIPDNRDQQVFVFGAVKKPGPVPIPPAGLTLSQAIGNSDIRDTGYDIHHIRIIRSLSATHGKLLVVDFDRILRGEALPLPLKDGDIIYVPKSGIGNWDDAIAEMLPSLQAISALLQPFVSIKYLERK